MAGFVLGTGSGVLASAMVYYTLSTSLHRETADIQHQLHHSARLLDSSFDPATPPAPSSLIGPPRNAPVPFSTLLAQRWNHAITSATTTVRQTDFLALGGTLIATTRDLAASLGNEMKGSASDIQKGKVGRDMGALEGGIGMDRLPGRISPDVSDPTRRDLREVKEFGEGVREEWGRIKESFKEGPNTGEVKGMAREMLGDRRLV